MSLHVPLLFVCVSERPPPRTATLKPRGPSQSARITKTRRSIPVPKVGVVEKCVQVCSSACTGCTGYVPECSTKRFCPPQRQVSLIASAFAPFDGVYTCAPMPTTFFNFSYAISLRISTIDILMLCFGKVQIRVLSYARRHPIVNANGTVTDRRD